MPNRLTKGKALVGQLVTADGGALPQTFTASLARTNTTDTTLFTLPAGFTVDSVTLTVNTASNAGTSATVSVGPSGTDTAWLNAVSVKTAGASLQGTAAVASGALSSATVVVGIYAESGTASTTGGPFFVTVQGH